MSVNDSHPSREFPTEVVLSAVTGVLLCRFSELHELLDHVSGAQLFTHQLPDASRAAMPHIVAQHPQLASYTVPDGVTAEDAESVVAAIHATYGERLPIAPMTGYDPGDPVETLVKKMGGKPVIVVTAETGAP